MAITKKILILVSVIGLMSFKQYPENLTPIRPKYAPDTVTHRNKLDDQGKKWGTWQSYSRNGMLILQMNYKNNKLNGVNITYFNPENDVVERGPDRFYELTTEEIMDKKSFGKNRGVVTR